MEKQEKIKLIAYRLWEKEGRPSGKDLEHYYRAEAIYAHQNKQPDTASSAAQSSVREEAAEREGHGHRAGHHRRRGQHHQSDYGKPCG